MYPVTLLRNPAAAFKSSRNIYVRMCSAMAKPTSPCEKKSMTVVRYILYQSAIGKCVMSPT